MGDPNTINKPAVFAAMAVSSLALLALSIAVEDFFPTIKKTKEAQKMYEEKVAAQPAAIGQQPAAAEAQVAAQAAAELPSSGTTGSSAGLTGDAFAAGLQAAREQGLEAARETGTEAAKTEVSGMTNEKQLASAATPAAPGASSEFNSADQLKEFLVPSSSKDKGDEMLAQ